MSATRFVAALIIFSVLRQTLSSKPGYYTIVAPGTVRSQSVFHVSISLSEFRQSCFFNISLTSFNLQEQLCGAEAIEIHPNTTKLIELRAPILKNKRGRLEVFSYRGIFSRDIAVVNFEPDAFSAFIQSNKPKYKPGELVQFRAIFIDQLTRPAKVDQEILVQIYDGQRNLIKIIAGVELVKGVLKGEFQLSDSPVLGDWRIKVNVGGDVVAEKRFEVARYSLRRFSVNIDSKPNVAIVDGKIVLDISARYFYGEPVKGNLTILLSNTYAALPDKLPLFTRALQINGNTTIVLDFKKDLHMENIDKNERSKVLYKFNVRAMVIDEISEEQSLSEVEIALHSQPFKIQLKAPKVFDGDEFLDFKVKVSITDIQDNPIKDNKGVVKIISECSGLEVPSIFDVETVQSEFIHPIGTESIAIQIGNLNFSECHLYAEYNGIKSATEWIKKNKDLLYLDILTENPEVGKDLEVKLKAKEPLESFSYEIVSRGDIIQSDHVTVPGHQRTFILHLNVTYSMVPKITIFVHSAKNRRFAAQLKDVFIKRIFQNSIEITADDEAQPGTSVHINVTTDEGSYVGLMGLDERILQSINNRDELTEDHFYTKLRNYEATSIDSNSMPGIRAGLITFSNALPKTETIDSRFGDEDQLIVGGKIDFEYPEIIDQPTLEFPRIRKLFSDSWLFKDFERSPAGGLNLLETVPDTITSWAITGFSINPNTGLTLTRNATKVKVFQDFFVSMDLPNSIKEGETIEVPIYISNYLPQDASTNITIEGDSEDLEISKQPETSSKSREISSKLIPAGERRKIIFFIKPRKPGKYNVTVKAISPRASDAVQKTLIVESEGIVHETSKTYLVHFPEESVQEDEIVIDIPENYVSGSERVEISVVGDIFRPLMSSLEKLARVPYGNGEDNMRFIVSNLLVLKYLKALNYTSPRLESKIRFHLELGYQNQLCFKHLDGSFGLFEQRLERSGDIWQTAFALWGLKQAKNFVQVDRRVLDRGLNYLKSKQLENGCFKSRNGIEEDVKFTAFGLMVFLMDDHSRTVYREVIAKGLAYLYEVSDSLNHTSISVMATYVLLLGNHDRASDSLMKLTSHERLTSQQRLWIKSDNLQSKLATTAGCLMNLFSSQKQPKQSLLHIVRGLITAEGEESSLIHMIALQAMIVFVNELPLMKKNLSITFQDDQKGSGMFYLNDENSQVLQTIELSQSSRKIKLQSKGYGFAVVDVKFKYNFVPENQSSSNYLIKITTSKRTSIFLSVSEICLSFLKNNHQNNITVMEVNLQSGHTFPETPFDKVEKSSEVIRSFQVNGSRDKVVVYIETTDKNEACFKLEALQTYKVLNAKPGWVAVYGANSKDQKTLMSFKI